MTIYKISLSKFQYGMVAWVWREKERQRENERERQRDRDRLREIDRWTDKDRINIIRKTL